MENDIIMYRTDIGQLQRLHDAIAITLDAIRRIAATSGPDYRTITAGGWIPAPPVDSGIGAPRARFEHSAWQPSWPPSFAHRAPWQDWSQPVAATTWTEPGRSWPETQTPGWPVVSYWGSYRPF